MRWKTIQGVYEQYKLRIIVFDSWFFSLFTVLGGKARELRSEFIVRCKELCISMCCPHWIVEGPSFHTIRKSEVV